jgi:dTDP-4-amino-4,6-dideoxygalactose transaminase
VFVDIRSDTFNLDPDQIEDAITPQTKAILPVHLYGQCVDMEPLWRIATQHQLAIVEDACQAIGAEYHGRRAGVLGAVGCFSFFPTKNLGGAGDGGMMTTDDADLAAKLRRLRVHGDIGGYEHVEVGMNSRLDALQAAVLRVKLRHLDDWTVARQQNARHYADLFRQHGCLSDVIMPKAMTDSRHVYNQYCVRFRNGLRNEVMQSLKEQKVGCAIYYPKPLHLQTCFKSLGYRAGDFPVSEAMTDEILALPIYPELPVSHQERVVTAIRAACDKARGQHTGGIRRAA